MLTTKSDDVVGRAKAFEAIVKGTDIPMPKVPESFKVLLKELNALGLNVVAVGATISDAPIDAPIETPEKLKESLAEEATEVEAKELAEASASEPVVTETIEQAATEGLEIAADTDGAQTTEVTEGESNE
jgi:DNA-directed RNA polymerase subunit beta